MGKFLSVKVEEKTGKPNHIPLGEAVSEFGFSSALLRKSVFIASYLLAGRGCIRL